MSLRQCGIWGYGPLLPGRFAEFMYASQTLDPDQAISYLRFNHYVQIYRMLRGRFAIGGKESAPEIMEYAGAMPHVKLIRQYAVLQGRNNILRAVLAPSFDPEQKVILESKPNPEPALSGEPGKVELKESGTDFLTIEADLAQPAILLVTDNYDTSWRARGLPASSQSRYEVMPADYTLRAIPVAAGHHEIRLEYMPAGFRIGRWISIVAAAGYLVALALYILRSAMRS
jgi:hypothetical protein